MKKVFVFFLSFLLLFPVVVWAEEVQEEPQEDASQEEKVEKNSLLIPSAKAGVLMDAATGKILFEKNKDEQLAVASMTKMVAQILILEAIESGKIKWSDKVTASENASGMGGSQIYLSTGETLTVEDMMKGISMASANDVVVTKKQLQVIREEITI
ncbi:MAG TPA: D-alanyl-D-alanine carboxypeptidase [Candidatus Onthousia faecigallinarum]|nr:D-alanyl-D-alanine carboxypeptidase [Candidatus Onthousia faecigallinarum]